jgi:hypothetical protein
MIPRGIRLCGKLLAFDLQYGEAAQMDEVTALPGTIAPELDLELHFAVRNAFAAHRAFDPGAPTAPYLIRYRVGEFTALDDFAGFPA